jgi:hypothetical protein
MNQMESDTKPKRSFMIRVECSDEFVHAIPGANAQITAKVYVDDQQIGCISSLEMKASAEEFFPSIVVRFAEGMTPDQAKALADHVKEAILGWSNQLKVFPFIQVESPLNE